MVFTPAPASSPREDFRALLEASYEKRNLMHLAAGSTVPLLRKSVWLVVRGMVKLTVRIPHGTPSLSVKIYTKICTPPLLP